MEKRAYGLIRDIVERLGGSMVYEREGYHHGAWIIRIGEKNAIIEATGNRSFPQLDRLYVPSVANPMHWDDYEDELVPDAETKLLALLGISSRPHPRQSPSEAAPESFPVKDIDQLAELIDRTRWKFAWTYARTYPHEYTTKAHCSPEDHARLVDCIEKYGISERFGNTHQKYFYFQERKYWTYGDPNSEDVEERPDVINRTWVDVRRHAANVQHRWTPEEVELQMRLWEIQLQKARNS